VRKLHEEKGYVTKIA